MKPTDICTFCALPASDRVHRDCERDLPHPFVPQLTDEPLCHARAAAPPSLPVQDDGTMRIDDQLPMPDKTILLWDGDMWQTGYHYADKEEFRVWGEPGKYRINPNVTHWRRLPAPPGTSTAPAVQDERAEFEKAFPRPDRDVMSGKFKDIRREILWEGWQARASRSASANSPRKEK